ncbi:MAG: Putative aldolase class 2 protein YgbL, partial [uncultured Acetobacteraceae bacterium]
DRVRPARRDLRPRAPALRARLLRRQRRQHQRAGRRRLPDDADQLLPRPAGSGADQQARPVVAARVRRPAFQGGVHAPGGAAVAAGSGRGGPPALHPRHGHLLPGAARRPGAAHPDADALLRHARRPIPAGAALLAAGRRGDGAGHRRGREGRAGDAARQPRAGGERQDARRRGLGGGGAGGGGEARADAARPAGLAGAGRGTGGRPAPHLQRM